MQFNRGKILHLGKNNSVHQYIVGAMQLERTLAEMDPVDTKLNMNQQSVLVAKVVRGLHLIQECQQAERGDPSIALGTGILCRVLGSPVQERHGCTIESPLKGHKDN